MTVNGNDILRVTARMLFDTSEQINNVYYVELATGDTTSDADAVDDMAVWMESIYTEIIADISHLVTFSDVYVWNVTQDRELGAAAWPTLTVGSGAGDTLPPGTAAVSTAYTGQKNTRARKFWPVYDEASQNAGNLGATPLARLVDASLVWVTAFTGFASSKDWLPGVVDKLGFILPFISVAARAAVGYQRRRKKGVGR